MCHILNSENVLTRIFQVEVDTLTLITNEIDVNFLLHPDDLKLICHISHFSDCENVSEFNSNRGGNLLSNMI